VTEGEIETVMMPVSDPEALPLAVRLVRGGQVVVFPTDTVYGVACDPWQPEAISRLYWSKRRPPALAIPVLVASASDVLQVAACLPKGFEELAVRFWPGALTLVVPRTAGLPAQLTAGGDTVAVRLPDHRWAREFIRAAGGALAVTSANLSGQPALSEASQVASALGGRISLIVDGGRCGGGVASTVVDLVASPPRVLRLGALPYETLREAVPHLAAPPPR
jgi:L-threonylcarbamoyladenylate synthase